MQHSLQHAAANGQRLLRHGETEVALGARVEIADLQAGRNGYFRMDQPAQNAGKGCAYLRNSLPFGCDGGDDCPFRHAFADGEARLHVAGHRCAQHPRQLDPDAGQLARRACVRSPRLAR